MPKGRGGLVVRSRPRGPVRNPIPRTIHRHLNVPYQCLAVMATLHLDHPTSIMIPDEVQRGRKSTGHMHWCPKITHNFEDARLQSVAETRGTYYLRNSHFTVKIRSRGQLGLPPERDAGENGV
ncbi:hypothetical protein AVEN_19459-1 [Araneus ventricosus]|uniref:Uncharacterized protein n=1 Tax=Araneus ventricosus TaxID=182803 RepID=A0A4Y2C894_ARAVE|nr:hypothetical protein AVEN_19459-1 [Araneus ventricosus]